MTHDSASPPRLRGRPRDPIMETRVLDAAIAIYSRLGWAGFTFDAVARTAGVGKEALYRRWSSRGDLLRQTLHERWYSADQIDTGSVREDLLALAGRYFETMAGPFGRAGFHLIADGEAMEEFRSEFSPYGDETKRQARQLVRRGIERGELPAATSVGFVLDLIFGALSMHISSTPPAMKDAMLTNADKFIAQLVDVTLLGIGGFLKESGS